MAQSFMAFLGTELSEDFHGLARRAGKSKSTFVRDVITQGTKQLKALEKRGETGEVEIAVIVRPKKKAA